MQRVLLFGSTGQVGTAIRDEIGVESLVAPTSRELSLVDPGALEDIIEHTRPRAVINAAAFTKVDEAESDPTAAYAINSTAPIAMAKACARLGVPLVHFSTDYVFDGTGTQPYDRSATTNPLNVYGASKRAGELGVLSAHPRAVVVRTAWVHSGSGINFVGTATRLLARGSTMRVVDDQIGTPTSAKSLAVAALRILDRPSVTGILHFTDSGVASWYDVACVVLTELQARGIASESAVVPVDSSEYPRPARRPRVSVLDCHYTRQRLDFVPPHWTHGVRESTRAWLASL